MKFAYKGYTKGGGGLKSFDEWYGPTYDLNSPEIQAELQRDAISVLHQTMKGRKVDRQAYDAAKFILGQVTYRQPPNAAEYHLHITPQAIDEAKRRAGLLPQQTTQENQPDVDTKSKD